jgi:hypothetical protein
LITSGEIHLKKAALVIALLVFLANLSVLLVIGWAGRMPVYNVVIVLHIVLMVISGMLSAGLAIEENIL